MIIGIILIFVFIMICLLGAMITAGPDPHISINATAPICHDEDSFNSSDWTGKD